MIEITHKRPYIAVQEELVRAINEQLLAKPIHSKVNSCTLKRIRRTLLDEQLSTNKPTFAFISGCRLTGRFDLLEQT